MTESVLKTLKPRSRDLGDFEVRRVLPSGSTRMVGPFIFFDHMGPAHFPAGRGIDIRPHPHINLATVTYLFEGSLMHRDSVGAVRNIQPGSVNWMTAGRGIVHSERSSDQFRHQDAVIHGIQSWVALPASEEECEPRFDHYSRQDLPVSRTPELTIRLIAGKAFDMESPVRFTHPIAYADLDVHEDTQIEIGAEHSERALYVADGSIHIEDSTYEIGQMVLLNEGPTVSVALSQGSRVMFVAGEPYPEPRHIWWNFVSSRPERIEQAKNDWQAQRFDAVPGENEFIPLPDQPANDR